MTPFQPQQCSKHEAHVESTDLHQSSQDWVDWEEWETVKQNSVTRDNNTTSKAKAGSEEQWEKEDLCCRNRDRCPQSCADDARSIFPAGQRYVADWASTAQTGEGVGNPCMLSATGMADRELMEVVLGMKLEYDQGSGRSQVTKWIRGQTAMQWVIDPKHLIQVEMREFGCNICLYLPLLLIYCPSPCQDTVHTDCSSIISSPKLHSSHCTSPARGSSPDKKFFIIIPFTTTAVMLASWMICDLLFAFPANCTGGKQEQTTHSNWTLNPLVNVQRKLYSKFTVYGGFYLNSV